MNTLGQSVSPTSSAPSRGTYRREMDLTGMSNGIYYLKGDPRRRDRGREGGLSLSFQPL